MFIYILYVLFLEFFKFLYCYNKSVSSIFLVYVRVLLCKFDLEYLVIYYRNFKI